MKLYPTLSVLMVVLSLSYTAVANSDEMAQYCVKKGGTVAPLTAWFHTKQGRVAGFSKRFCMFERDHGSLAIGLTAFASPLPNIAATYMKKLAPISSGSKLMEGGPGNPSYYVCKNLGGTTIGFGFAGNFQQPDGGEVDICVFGDGSMVSGWTLVYMANHRSGYDEVKADVRSNPLDVDVS